MLLSEYYKESVHSENGANYEILEAGKNQRAKFTVRCTVCQTVATVMASSILSGRKPCLCSTRSGKTTERKLQRLMPILESRKMDLVSDSVGKAKDPLKVYCNVCENFLFTTYNSLVLKGNGCKYCANNVRPTENEFLSFIVGIGRKSNFTVKEVFNYSDKPLRYVEISLICTKCNNNWITKKDSVRNGSSCPHCAYSGFNTSLPAKLYILRVVSEDNVLQGYKYGITCDIERRLYEHKRDCRPTDINFELAFSWDYASGLDAQMHERTIKKKFGSYFSQWELPSGFTETISITDLGELVDFQIKQYKDLFNGRYY
jgi:predicted GIY-YIG superfamily endonuclease/ribosomal protein L44E